MIRIANGQGFWGDLPQAPRQQVEGGPIDVLSLEYLAEVTLGILARIQENNPGAGYIPDFHEQIDPVLETCLDRGISIVTSAGGLNPAGCAEQLKQMLPTGHDARIATVSGDDCFTEFEDWADNGDLPGPLAELLSRDHTRVLAVNRYLGSEGIAEALREDADIVVAGRVTDTALVLGPAMAAHGWELTDYDRLARGIVAGHLLECGGQATGGNFSGTDEVPDLWNIGFPIAEIDGDGDVVITKHDSLGGTVTRQTVMEQMLYELTEPDAYLTPDVTVDMTGIELEEVGENRVRVSGASGSAPPETDKISVLVETGYQVSGHLTYCGPDPVDKARRAQEILRRRMDELGEQPDQITVETLGYDACHGELSTADASRQDEVVFRVSARADKKEPLEALGKQIMGLILTGPPGATGFAEGRPRPKPVIEHHSVYRPRMGPSEVEWV